MNKNIKKFLNVFFFSFILFFLLTVSVSAATVCTYEKQIFTWDDNRNLYREFDITVVVDGDASAKTVKNAKLTDNMKDLGMGISKKTEQRTRFWNYDSYTNKNPGLLNSSFDKVVTSPTTYVEWINAKGNLCPPYVVAYGQKTAISSYFFGWIANNLSDAKNIFQQARDVSALSNSLPAWDYWASRTWAYNNKWTETGHSYMEILPLITPISKQNALVEDTQMMSMANVIEEMYKNMFRYKECERLGLLNGPFRGECPTKVTNAELKVLAGEVRINNMNKVEFTKAIPNANERPGYEKLFLLVKGASRTLGLESNYSPVAVEKTEIIEKKVQEYEEECQGEAAKSEECKEKLESISADLEEFKELYPEWDAAFFGKLETALGIGIQGSLECSDFADEEGNLFEELWGIILIIAPILVVVFGTLDFSKAALASDDQAMKKAWSNFVKRIIAAILLILLPFIIHTILSIAYDDDVVDVRPIICINRI